MRFPFHKLRSGFHKPTMVEKDRRNKMTQDFLDKQLYNDSIEVYEDLMDKLVEAKVLLRRFLLRTNSLRGVDDLAEEVKEFLERAD